MTEQPFFRRRFLAIFAAIAAASAVFFYASFFLNLRSTLSDWSGFGYTWEHQLFYNLLHGRPWQCSIYAPTDNRNYIGYIDNPYAFVHSFALHIYWTPMLFALPWALSPTVEWLYGILFLWNLAGMALLGRLILGKLDPKGAGPKALFAAAVLASSGLLNILDQAAQFLLFCGPFMMAAYYFFLARRRLWFFLSVVALCLLVEDAAMVAVCFGVYLWLFEPEGKPYARDCLLFSIPYLLLALLVIQPSARAEMTLTESTLTVAVMKRVFLLTPRAFGDNLFSMLPVASLPAAFWLGGELFGWPKKVGWRRVLALAVVPGLPHWAECLGVGAAHHLLPAYTAVFLALLAFLGAAEERSASSVPARAFAAAGIFFLLSWRADAGNLPNRLRAPLYRLVGKTEKAQALEKSLTVAEASNRAVIAAARAIPADKSLCYFVNSPAVGFLADRSAMWEFPDYFDTADYLLVQKDAIDVVMDLGNDPNADLRGIISSHSHDARHDRNTPIRPAGIAVIKNALLNGPGRHRIVRDDDHVLLIENLEPHVFENPATTRGLGWLRNVGKRPKRVAPLPGV